MGLGSELGWIRASRVPVPAPSGLGQVLRPLWEMKAKGLPCPSASTLGKALFHPPHKGQEMSQYLSGH